MRYSKYDEVILKVSEDFGYDDQIYAKLKVMILGFDSDHDGGNLEYLCYIPAYEKIPYKFPTFVINLYHTQHFNVEKKFLGDIGCIVSEFMTIYKHIPAAQGENCDRCDEWFDDAKRIDNVYFCRSCVENPWR